MARDKPTAEIHPNPPPGPAPRIALPGRDFNPADVLKEQARPPPVSKKMVTAAVNRHEQGIGGLANNFNILRKISQNHANLLNFHTEAMALLTVVIASEVEEERAAALRYLRSLLPSALEQLEQAKGQEGAMLRAQAEKAAEAARGKLKLPAEPAPEGEGPPEAEGEPVAPPP